MKNTLSKSEILRGRKTMELLFSSGRSATAYPLRIVYVEKSGSEGVPARAMFVVPKKNFQKAHDRNRLKRRMKEAYRLQKILFFESLGKQKKNLDLALIYSGKKDEDYKKISGAVIKLLEKAISRNSVYSPP